jgi:hypothetical protein
MNAYKESTQGEYKHEGIISSDGTKTIGAGGDDFVWVLVEANGNDPFVSIEVRGVTVDR